MYSDHFGINNIPFGVASSSTHSAHSVATRYNDTVIFIDRLLETEFLKDLPPEVHEALAQTTLNDFIALPKDAHREVRSRLQNVVGNFLSSLPQGSTCPANETTLHLPIRVNDFTDFSCSLDHVENAAEAIFNKREAPPGFDYFPVGYNGRSSSIFVSGTDVLRPYGQFRVGDKIVYGASQKMDYELEVGAIIGKNSKIGEAVDLIDADDYIFGLVLVNDWSARDIQALEMNPLGPLNGKSFGTSMSPWIITLDAIEKFRTPMSRCSKTRPSYLKDPEPKPTYEISLKATLQPEGASKATTICESQLSSLYWTLRDLVAHSTINGCNLRVGDLLASGTISGTSKYSHGCLLEAVVHGGIEVENAKGEVEKRMWLENGDRVTLTALAGHGVGFGECTGLVLPAAKNFLSIR